MVEIKDWLNQGDCLRLKGTRLEYFNPKTGYTRRVHLNTERLKVVIEVLGGVATVKDCPHHLVEVEIIDHDNESAG